MEKMCVWEYIYIYMNHFAIQHKSTPHCKSTILQKIILKTKQKHAVNM